VDKYCSIIVLKSIKIYLITNEDVGKIMQDIIRVFKFIFPEEYFSE